jgi:hypothetical protein
MSLKAEDVIEIRKMIVAAEVGRRGPLKAELDAIIAENAKLEAKHGALLNIKASEEARAKAEGILAAEKATMERQQELRQEELKKLAEERALLKQKQSEAEKAKEEAFKAREIAVRLQRKLDNDAKDLQAAWDGKFRALEEREEKLRATEEALSKERAELQAKVKRLREVTV